MTFDRLSLGDLRVQSGAVLPNAMLAYKTYGALNRARDNAVPSRT